MPGYHTTPSPFNISNLNFTGEWMNCLRCANSCKLNSIVSIFFLNLITDDTTKSALTLEPPSHETNDLTNARETPNVEGEWCLIERVDNRWFGHNYTRRCGVTDTNQPKKHRAILQGQQRSHADGEDARAEAETVSVPRTRRKPVPTGYSSGISTKP